MSETTVVTIVSRSVIETTVLTPGIDIVTEILVASGPQGSVGPRGAPGPGTVRFEFDQVTPAASWFIAHNLGGFPTVTVVIGGEDVLTDVEYVDANSVNLSFASPVAGSAYIF